MSVTIPKGFKASGVAAGLKQSGTPDVALIQNLGPSYAAASVFTSNRCKANPVLWSEQAIADGEVRAVVVNSGGANCYTGSRGFQTTHATAERVGALLDVSPGDVLVASTGLIGELLDEPTLFAGVDAAAAELSDTGGDAAARAIMTTDTVPKTASYAGDGWSIGGIAKGAGMLAPSLATMLVFVTTDADLDASELESALRVACARSFDRIDSDGCMSTNDQVALLSSGASGVRPDVDAFTSALTDLCLELALQLIRDAEGASHDIAITTTGAASEQDALEVCRAVARSNLLKCAIFGNDPNWGRILAAVGTTGAEFDPQQIDVAINDVWICRGGEPGESRDQVDMSARDVTITIDLKAGEHEATLWTNDLTTDYVHENSAYST
ncbi:bifunctional glutamate N-acetyltransferase/amino-acid acetyltransferase ArgJ [Blastococcus sp. Marseille-P5729]|uniref:bifunctional glutamate N-acetyltransferase/amino-acid acetyltransferase ArgJ n=1 Tax=Blastococcus sp. Marseille-P5729 TaxID=2086582 RepID=UPI000D107AB2|nr:bifunctional glutamate N-acetyltransferase/amino-acid acetyltransferase ArgJ [Blastococcus sp. Marseille-P5729]